MERIQSKLPASIRALVGSGDTKEEITPLDGLEDTRFYNLSYVKDIMTATIETGMQGADNSYVNVEVRGLTDVVMIPCENHQQANAIVHKLMTYRADVTKETYLIMKADGLIDFVQVERVDL